jgi:RND family efflux transporter MFP subunit
MKKLLPYLLFVILGIGLWVWYRHHSAGEAPEEESKPVAEVQVAPLQVQPISQTLAAFGVVEAAPAGAQAVTLGYDGVVQRIAAPSGARVAAGDLVLEIRPTADAQLQLDSARSSAALAEKSLAATRQRYDLRLATSQDLLAAEQASEDASLKLVSYQKRLAGGEGRITAATAGVVTKLDWQPGSMVPAGTVLAVIGTSSQLEAHLTVEASDADRVRPGQSVILASANRPKADAVTGTVRLVGGVVDAASGAVDVRVPLPPAAGWYPGEHVQGEIELQRKTALVAPREAVLPDDDKQVLYVVKDGKAVRHEIATGIVSADSVEVIGPDVRAGDAVVVQGNYELDDGMAVQVAPAAKADDAPGSPDVKQPEIKP